MKELSFVDETTAWTLRTEELVSPEHTIKLHEIITTLVANGLTSFNASVDDYPGEDGNEGIVVNVTHTDARLWQEFLKLSNTSTFRVIEPEDGHSEWTKLEYYFINLIRNFVIELNDTYRFISLGVSPQ